MPGLGLEEDLDLSSLLMAMTSLAITHQGVGQQARHDRQMDKRHQNDNNKKHNAKQLMQGNAIPSKVLQ